MSQNLNGNPATVALDEPLFAADVLSRRRRRGAATVAAGASVRAKTARHGWRFLTILSALMGFASISTDLYLPAIFAMGASLGANTGIHHVQLSDRLQLRAIALGSDQSPLYSLSACRCLVFFVIGSAGWRA